MNFVVPSTVLLRHLQNISGVLSTSNTLPILDNFLFEINKNSLTVSASDIQTIMKTTLDIESNDEGNIAIPARLILDILKNLPDQPCTFTIDDQNFGIEIAYDNGKAKMVGFDGDDFPRIPDMGDTASVNVSGDIIAKAIAKTIFAAGNDDLRPVMSGVFCQFSPSEIIFVATDAHKLVKYARTDSSATGSSSFILPKKPLNLLKANLRGDEDIQIEYTSSNAIFSFENTKLICRLIDGKYPNYDAVIPQESPNVLTIDRNQILGSLKRVSIFANKTTHLIKMRIAGSELSLSAEDIDFSNESDERLTCFYEGDDIEIGFNGRFLTEMLSNLECDEIKIKMSEPSRAGIITPSNIENKDENILMVLMPLMLNR